MARRRRDLQGEGWLETVEVVTDRSPDLARYPFTIPAVRALLEAPLSLDPRVTFLVGENGSGKSTLLEAIAVAAGFNAEGGSRSFDFATRRSESSLAEHLRLSWGRRPRDGYFFRAESFYNVASEIERLDAEGGGPRIIDSYGGRSLHDMSHGESLVTLVSTRFRGQGLYLLDEPDSALSPLRQLSLLAVVHRLVRERSQLVIATHSPILMAYPGAAIHALGPDGLVRVSYDEAEPVTLARGFLAAPDRYLRHLLADDDAPAGAGDEAGGGGATPP